MTKPILRYVVFILAVILTLSVSVFAEEENGMNTAENGNIIILMYHDFRVENLSETDNPAYVTTDIKFREDIEKLFNMGYESLSLERLYNGDYDASQDYFIITVDDGYISNYEVLFPIVTELEIYADIFMCTEDAVRKNHFQYSEAKKMENSGYIKVYSHCTAHIDALSLEIDDFNRLAEKAFRHLEKKISEDRLRIFAYPHGSYSRRTVESLYKNGTVFQMVQDVIKVDDENWNPADYGVLYRVNVEYEVDMTELVEYYITQYCAR